NELRVGLLGEVVEDDVILADSVAALDADNHVPKGSLTVLVTDGWVTLRGEVRHHFEKTSARHAVGRVAGVLGITDEITIGSQPIPSDVADRINKAFRRSAIIDDSRIQVSSSGHTIYLDGEVGSWFAMRDAENAAWNAPGVTNVVDRLLIDA
ncbi:MAG TPA: BON domain-containing protein, partial [Acidimicrobiales bacterium]|nr:BON domain-containing protein [Acidimicrobiales bacterium]